MPSGRSKSRYGGALTDFFCLVGMMVKKRKKLDISDLIDGAWYFGLANKLDDDGLAQLGTLSYGSLFSKFAKADG
jgi:hypothetical protein